MRQESAVRAALARLFALRHGRDVPIDELHRALVADGHEEPDLEGTLRALQAAHLAVETSAGWRPAAPPPGSRSGSAMASFSWLHPRR